MKELIEKLDDMIRELSEVDEESDTEGNPKKIMRNFLYTLDIRGADEKKGGAWKDFQKLVKLVK